MKSSGAGRIYIDRKEEFIIEGKVYREMGRATLLEVTSLLFNHDVKSLSYWIRLPSPTLMNVCNLRHSRWNSELFIQLYRNELGEFAQSVHNELVEE